VTRACQVVQNGDDDLVAVPPLVHEGAVADDLLQPRKHRGGITQCVQASHGDEESFDRFNDLMGDHAVRRAGRTTYPPRPICGPVIRAAQVQ
jgi:hypothetical protein